MKNKRIGNIERILIAECVKDIPSFAKINRLFEMGADPNAVNEYGESVLSIVFEGYCSLYGANLRSGFFAPHLVTCFIQNGFDVRKHGLFVISELENGIYDKHIRRAISMILTRRRQLIKKDVKTAAICLKMIAQKVMCGRAKTA